MKIVAFLQNLWVKDPARTERLFAAHPEKREYILKCLLFLGGRTGNILKCTLGQDVIDQIAWEESTKQIAGDSRGVFPPDYEHIKAVILKHRPEIVLAFGKIASTAVIKVSEEMLPEPATFHFRVLSAPHPCARPAQDPIGALMEIKTKLTPYLS